ncbi:MAG TPA: TetR/AcrR family transcriptional regulator [Flavobacterium sp.]|nr:TetR/AcrR family transcriptional regulator [Flavobacterium sp.]
MGKADRTKQHIIEQAAPLFNQKGIAGTSIDDVLVAAQITKGCLYSHFEGKEALSIEVVDYLLDKVTSRAKAAINKEVTAKKKLYAYLDLYKDPLNPMVAGGCPILNFGTEADDTNVLVREKVKAVIGNSIKNFTAIINTGIQDKEFRPEFNAEEFSLKMYAIIEGSIMIGRVMQSSRQMETVVAMLKKEIRSYEV